MKNYYKYILYIDIFKVLGKIYRLTDDRGNIICHTKDKNEIKIMIDLMGLKNMGKRVQISNEKHYDMKYTFACIMFYEK